MEDISSNKELMTKQKIKKVRKKRMRSYREVMHFLWAFGIAGLILGIGIIGYFGLQRRWNVALLGVVYTLTAAIFLGIRGIISNLDQKRKQQRHIHSRPKS